jgi:hypothetical protein
LLRYRRKKNTKTEEPEAEGDLILAFLERIEVSMQMHPLWASLDTYELRRARDELHVYIFTKLYKQYVVSTLTTCPERVN